MKTIKTSELSGTSLDWAVAKCEGARLPKHQIPGTPCAINVSPGGHDNYQPSTDWSQGGPIIEREKIGIDYFDVGNGRPVWVACLALKQETGPTPMIAAMRCYVASKLGDTINVPEELL